MVAYYGLHPAGVHLGDLAESQGSCLDHKVIGRELELVWLMAGIDLATQAQDLCHVHVGGEVVVGDGLLGLLQAPGYGLGGEGERERRDMGGEWVGRSRIWEEGGWGGR